MAEDKVMTLEVDIDYIGVGSTDKTFMCYQCCCEDCGLWYEFPQCLAYNCDYSCLCCESGYSCGYTDDGVRVCEKDTCQYACLDCFGTNTAGKREYILYRCAMHGNYCCCCKGAYVGSCDFGKITPGCTEYGQCCCFAGRCACMPDEATPLRIGLCSKQFMGKQAVWNEAALKAKMTVAEYTAKHPEKVVMAVNEMER